MKRLFNILTQTSKSIFKKDVPSRIIINKTKDRKLSKCDLKFYS